MKRGAIVLINASFTDLSGTKTRPALIIISREEYNNQNDMVLILKISNTSRLNPDDYVLEDRNLEFKNTGIKQSFAFRVGKVIAIHKKLLICKFGFAGPNTMKEVEKRLRNLLQL